MQYKIPLQIENEDEIFLGLSLRQIAIIGGFGGVAYGIFHILQQNIGNTWAIIFAAPIAIFGIVVALVRVAEMTFLPMILNLIRLSLNEKERLWVQWAGSFSELEIGYVLTPETANNQKIEDKQEFHEMLNSNDSFAEKLKNL